MKEKKRIKLKKKSAARKDLFDKYKLLAYLMDNISDVIYFKDTKGKLIMVNQAYAKGLGLKPEEIAGKTDFDFFSRKRAAIMARDDAHVMKTGRSFIDKIERATRPDRVDNYVSTTKMPMYDNRGRIIGLMGVTRDITRRRNIKQATEEKMRNSPELVTQRGRGKLKPESVAAVSHELKTPLAIVKQLTLLLFNETHGSINTKQREMLTKINNHVDSLSDMVDELFDMSTIERDKLKLQYSLANFNDLLKSSSVFFKKVAKDKGINLRYCLSKKEVNIFIDTERINQILINLITNAIKYTSQGGRVKVEVKVMENKVRVGVIDTGIGISKSDLHHVFDKFVQASNIPDGKRKGLGLGLSIVRELVEMHGGEIWVDSTLGVGSEFYFTLPRFYAINALNRSIKKRIGNLLNQGISLQFVNLSIINYKEFSTRVRVNPKRLLKDFKAIIGATSKKVYQPKLVNSPMILIDEDHGQCSLILPEATEKEAAEACKLLRESIKNYFKKNKIENIFIILGFLSYSQKMFIDTISRKHANLFIKEVWVGSELRYAKRILYKTNIKLLISGNKSESSRTVDISKTGICFVSKRSLKANSQIDISLNLVKGKRPIHAKARIAWVKKAGRLPGMTTDRYKVGLEFIDLKDKYEKILSREIESQTGERKNITVNKQN